MICVAVKIHESALTRQARVSAPSIARALRIAGDGRPGRRVRLQRFSVWLARAA
jgi:hypothetical protein